jgi:hypothetical protein
MDDRSHPWGTGPVRLLRGDGDGRAPSMLHFMLHFILHFILFVFIVHVKHE